MGVAESAGTGGMLPPYLADETLSEDGSRGRGKMNCTACGQKLDWGAQYCSGCGRALVVSSPALRMTEPLVRPREGRMVAGVCRGFAVRYGWDVAIVRLVVLLSILFAGVPLIAYLVAWIVMPNGQFALPAQAGVQPGVPSGVQTGARPGSMGL